MAKISLEGAAIAAGVGALDIAAEEIDAKQGYSKPFQNATDLSRAGVTVGAAVANYMNLETRYTDVAFYAGLPLFSKTIYRLANQAIKRTTTVRDEFSQVRAVTVRAGQASGLQEVVPAQQQGNYRSITS